MTILTTANTPQVLYTCPASKVATKNVRLCNTGSAAATYTVWKGTTTPNASGGSVTGDEWIYNAPIAAGGYAEVTGIYLTASEKLTVMVSNTAVSVNAHGPERSV